MSHTIGQKLFSKDNDLALAEQPAGPNKLFKSLERCFIDFCDIWLWGKKVLLSPGEFLRWMSSTSNGGKVPV